MRLSTFGVAALYAAAANAQVRGFNYGSSFTTGAAKAQSDFEDEFNAAKKLPGVGGFTSARLYTMIQSGTTNTPISAIPAAIATNTTLLLGLWASGGSAAFNNEVTALTSAIQQYGSSFADLIVGISVGSEDLYRISPTGIENNSGAGAQPAEIIAYVNQVRNAIKSTAASGKLVGHVDTWTAWVNASQANVIAALDFLGMDGYPYFETTRANSIDNANASFFSSYDATVAAAQGKPVWVTETGWPTAGPVENQAVASVQNAQTYWNEAACTLFGSINTWWYTLQDAEPDTPSPTFGLLPAGDILTVQPVYNLSCPAGTNAASKSVNGTSNSSSSASAASQITSTVTTQIGATSFLTVTTIQAGSSSAATPVASSVAASQVAPSSGAIPVSPSSAAPVAISGSPVAPSSGAFSVAAQPAPTDLSGAYEFPHLIVPVDKSNPSTPQGNSYTAYVSPTNSSIFNFDIPASDAGKTCNLVFIFPNRGQQWWTPYTVKSVGGISVVQLSTPATEATTWDNAGNGTTVASVPQLQAGSSYPLSSGPCAAGQKLGYRLDSTGGLDLSFFESTSPALGLFVTIS